MVPSIPVRPQAAEAVACGRPRQSPAASSSAEHRRPVEGGRDRHGLPRGGTFQDAVHDLEHVKREPPRGAVRRAVKDGARQVGEAERPVVGAGGRFGGPVGRAPVRRAERQGVRVQRRASRRPLGDLHRRRRRSSDRARAASPRCRRARSPGCPCFHTSQLMQNVTWAPEANSSSAMHVGRRLDRDPVALARGFRRDDALREADARHGQHALHGPDQVDEGGEVVRRHVEDRAAARLEEELRIGMPVLHPVRHQERRSRQDPSDGAVVDELAGEAPARRRGRCPGRSRGAGRGPPPPATRARPSSKSTASGFSEKTCLPARERRAATRRNGRRGSSG